MKKIFVCSPLRGDIKENINKAKGYSKRIVSRGHIPITPHIYFTQFLDDTIEAERNMGRKMGMELLRLCDELWVFGDKITEGMKKEIDYCKKIKKKIIYIENMKKLISLISTEGKTKKQIKNEMKEAWQKFEKSSEKEQEKAFYDLLSGQGSFLPPIGKHNQGKLFTK